MAVLLIDNDPTRRLQFSQLLDFIDIERGSAVEYGAWGGMVSEDTSIDSVFVGESDDDNLTLREVEALKVGLGEVPVLLISKKIRKDDLLPDLAARVVTLIEQPFKFRDRKSVV